MHDTDVASRSESRREAMLARKQRQTHVDSDFDDPRSTRRAAHINGKSKRVGEIAAESVAGLGISGVAPVAKKKRSEKPAAGGMAMERSLSGALGGRALSREPSQQEGTKKRKAPASAPTTAARKRYEHAPCLDFRMVLIIRQDQHHPLGDKLAQACLLPHRRRLWQQGWASKQPHAWQRTSTTFPCSAKLGPRAASLVCLQQEQWKWHWSRRQRS